MSGLGAASPPVVVVACRALLGLARLAWERRQWAEVEGTLVRLAGLVAAWRAAGGGAYSLLDLARCAPAPTILARPEVATAAPQGDQEMEQVGAEVEEMLRIRWGL